MLAAARLQPGQQRGDPVAVSRPTGQQQQACWRPRRWATTRRAVDRAGPPAREGSALGHAPIPVRQVRQAEHAEAQLVLEWVLVLEDLQRSAEVLFGLARNSARWYAR